MNQLLSQRILCDEITSKHVGQVVTVAGWVYHLRDQGGILFIDIRERSGQLQIVFDKNKGEGLFNTAESLRQEDVILVCGLLQDRDKETINPNLLTGEIELVAQKIIKLNTAETLPIPVDEFITNTSEDNRLKYRYLDLRRPDMQNILKKRHSFFAHIRDFLNTHNFWEIETPILNKSTPEGARDFLVPSRLNQQCFYALPQSPQIFKQILMVSQTERYYQIARCFRDEDLRKDRQPEFTQLDIEMSFMTQKQIMVMMEELLTNSLHKIFDIDIRKQVAHMTYSEAMEKYGTDRPDLRYEMQLTALDEWSNMTEFNVFKKAVSSGGRVIAIRIPKGGSLSRKDIDELTEWVTKECQAKGLAWIKHTEKGLESLLMKFIPDKAQVELIKKTGSQMGDILFFAADTEAIAFRTLSSVRTLMANKMNMVPANTWKALWITDFPLFYLDPKTKTLDSVHNPFSAPLEKDLPFLTSLKTTTSLDLDTLIKLSQIKSKAYDITLNGVEIGGGSIRIHNPSLQKKIFKLLGLSEANISKQFGFFLQALGYGAPPHGGIAFGLDRILMLCLRLPSIRDTIPFPKTQKGQCLMSQAPSTVETSQLLELAIRKHC